ncbi:MAG: helix-turn-helix transcriptional regulator [Proteobacteria bacterium]|nr:helix-turn-helix transcriptional regulator [Pseudomonadota bacterium]
MAEPAHNRRANTRQLRQIVVGLGEGVILVGPDKTITWANDAALGMHGVETLEGLGEDVAGYRRRFALRYRNNHPLDPGEYPIDRVVAGETFADVVVEVTPTGADEPRSVHSVRSLVLLDDDETPEVFVLVLQDASARFEAEERFEKTFNANPAPAVIARLSDLRYVKVNVGFLEMTGFDREAVLGRSVYEVDVMEGADRRDVGIERLTEGRTIPQMEATLRLPQGGTKTVIVAGQPIEIGEEPCMLFTFMDMEPRKKAEDALRQSEERFAKSFRLAPVPTFISNAETGLTLDINDAFTAATGYRLEDTIGRTPVDLRLWDRAAAQRLMEAGLATTGSLRNLETQVRTKEGVLLDCLISAETVTIHGQSCVLSVLQDITERKRSEVELMAAIEAVMQDASWFSSTVIEKMAALRRPRGSNRPAPELADLSPREHDILGLICQGLADKEIARTTGLAVNTVRNHVATIYGKLDVHSRSALMVWARERGITGPAPRAGAKPKKSAGDR